VSLEKKQNILVMKQNNNNNKKKKEQQAIISVKNWKKQFQLKPLNCSFYIPVPMWAHSIAPHNFL